MPSVRKTKKRRHISKPLWIIASACTLLALVLAVTGLAVAQQERVAEGAAEAATYTPAARPSPVPSTQSAAAPTMSDAEILAAAFEGVELDPELTVTSVLDGQPSRIDLPFEGPAKAVAIYFHGQGGDVNDRMNSGWLNGLRSNGWAVASSDFHGTSWGSSDAVATVEEVAKWAETTAGAPLTMFVGASMGGLVSLDTLVQTDLAPRCWYGVMPVVDLDRAAETVSGAPGQIINAYGFKNRDTGNAALHLDELPDNVSYRVLSSPQDTVVLAKDHSALLATALTEKRFKVTSMQVSGEHGDPSHFNTADLADFASRCVA